MGIRRIYQSKYPYFITTKTQDNFWHFDRTQYTESLTKSIFCYATKYNWYVYSYIIMPDHLHILAKQNGNFNISQFMQALKSSTYQSIKSKFKEHSPIWQKGFYDQIVKNKTQFIKTLRYIKENPINALLDESFMKFPNYYIHKNFNELL